MFQFPMTVDLGLSRTDMRRDTRECASPYHSDQIVSHGCTFFCSFSVQNSVVMEKCGVVGVAMRGPLEGGGS